MNNIDESFANVLSKIKDDLNKATLKTIGLDVLKIDYEENARRVVEYVEDWPDTYSDCIRLVQSIYSSISYLNNNGYDRLKYISIFENLDKLMFKLLGPELDRDIVIKRVAPDISKIGTRGNNTQASTVSAQTSQRDISKNFRYLYGRMNVISTYNINSVTYTNFKSSVSSDPLFEIAWRNLIDNRSNTQELYDLMRTMIIVYYYESNDLTNVMGSPSAVKPYIDSLTNPGMLISSINQNTLLDPAHHNSIVSQFDANVPFTSKQMKDTFIGALRGVYTSSNGFVWNTTVEDNVKITAWMLNIAYNIIGSNQINQII